MNINIQSATTQQATAAQITALANHILHRCGDVDFTGTDVTLQCTDTLPLGAAAIVQTCAHKQGATSFSISGASDLADSVWALVENIPSWMIDIADKYGIDFINTFNALAIDEDIVNSFNDVGRWLVADANAYIDTGLTTDANTSMEVKFDHTSVSDYWTTVFGVRNDKTNRYIALSSATDIVCGYSTTRMDVSISNAISVVRLNPTSILVNGVQKATFTETDDSTSNIFLFATSPTATLDHKTGMKIANFIVYENDVIKAFFIPMTKDSVNGMYDLIGQQFYANANTSGAFTIE